jgi:hypothetical protein
MWQLQTSTHVGRVSLGCYLKHLIDLKHVKKLFQMEICSLLQHGKALTSENVAI